MTNTNCCEKCRKCVNLPSLNMAIQCSNDSCSCHTTPTTDEFVEGKVAEFVEKNGAFSHGIVERTPAYHWLRKALLDAIEFGKDEAEFENKKLQEMTAFSEGAAAERERLIQSLQKQPEVLSMPGIVPVIRRIIENL